MDTNGANNVEDSEMAECDGEKVVTMMDVLQEQQEFEADANAVLGASDDKNCTYSKGYIKRQALYACLTCCADAKSDDTKRAGVCLACSLNCHENHELIELYTKRNFRCDCGNPKFNNHPCQFTSEKTELNNENNYNQNFSGIYCICHRPYPDPEATEEVDMIQCIICEDWLHASHLNAVVPGNEQYSEMICKACMESNEFLHNYSKLAVNVDKIEPDVDVTTINRGTEEVVCNGITEKEVLTNGHSESVDDSNIKEDASANTEFKLETKEISESEFNSASGAKGSDDKSITDPEGDKNKSIENNVTVPMESDETDTSDVSNSKTEEKITSEVAPEMDNTKDTEINEEKPNNDPIETEEKKESDKNEELSSKECTDSTIDDNTEKEPSEDKKDTTEASIDKTENTKSTNEKLDVISTEITESNVDTNEAVSETNDNITKDIDKSKESNTSSPSEDSTVAKDNSTNIDNSTESDTKLINGASEISNSLSEDNTLSDKTKADDGDTTKIKRKLSTEEASDDCSVKKPKLNEETTCVRPKGVGKVYKGATFWPSNFRQKLCTCGECITMYKNLNVLFLTDPEDTVTAYETLGEAKIDGGPSTQYEKGLQALSSLDRIQQINALTEYNKMRDKLLDFLKNFKERKEVVKEEDIKAFFAGMKPKREPDGVYFCR